MSLPGTRRLTQRDSQPKINRLQGHEEFSNLQDQTAEERVGHCDLHNNGGYEPEDRCYALSATRCEQGKLLLDLAIRDKYCAYIGAAPCGIQTFSPGTTLGNAFSIEKRMESDHTYETAAPL